MKPHNQQSRTANFYDTSNLEISYADNVKHTLMSRQKFEELVSAIKSNTSLKSKVEVVRAEHDIDKRRDLKQQLLGYFNFGSFRDNKRKNANIISTEFIILDFDHVNNLNEKREQLEKDPRVFCVFTSPSGDGIKVVCRLENAISNLSEFSRIYKYHAAAFGIQLGEKEDRTSDVSRACYVSYDPNLYLNQNAIPLTTNVPNSEIKKRKESPKRQEMLDLTKGGWSDSERTDWLVRMVGLYKEQGFDKEFTRATILVLNKSNNPPLDDRKIIDTVESLFKDDNPKFHITQNSYYKNQGNVQITSFIIQPKELLVLEDRDCLKCDIVTKKYTYENILIENIDWHSKQRFLKAIGHQDCVFLGSDSDLQALCYYVQESVPLRKKGVKTIGLYDGVWVTEDMNITKDGILSELVLVPYDKGGDAFYHQIKYSQEEFMLKEFYDNILKINERNLMLSNVGWVFATPVKPIITKFGDGFPLLFNHGGTGTGKSSMAQLFIRLVGYTDVYPKSCTMKSFPMLKTLSSTNAIPQWYDEFKKADMKEIEYDSLMRYMRRVYKGEIEEKGRQDQTVESYQLTAPMAVMGEWNINQPAIMERVIVIRTTDVIKKNTEMQEAYGKVKELKLESFMPFYIQFCLNQNIELIFNEANTFVKDHFKGKEIAPRIINNLAVMVLGVKLFTKYAEANSIVVDEIDYSSLLDYQLKEITGSTRGMVRSAVDQLIEELSVMAEGGHLSSLRDDYKKVVIGNVPYLAIQFNKIFPQFKEYARRTNYEGDLLDKVSYGKLFEDCEYVLDNNKNVKYSNNKVVRSLVLDIEKAKAIGINLDGFGV